MDHVHYGCRFRFVTTGQANPSTSSWVMKRYSNRSFADHCLGWKQQKALLTCNQARDNERKNQHLEHTHQQLTREGEILDLAIGQLVGPEGEGQDNPCGWAEDEKGSGTVWSSGLSLSPTMWLFSFSSTLSSSSSQRNKCSFSKRLWSSFYGVLSLSLWHIYMQRSLVWNHRCPCSLSVDLLESVPRKLMNIKCCDERHDLPD